jgi:hypothetical protein
LESSVARQAVILQHVVRREILAAIAPGDASIALARFSFDDTVVASYGWRLGRTDRPDFGVLLSIGA